MAASSGFVDRLVRWCLQNRLIVVLGILALIWGGILVAPFEWRVGGVPRSPVPVDAIPDLGEKQQIVFTEWPGRSPQDVEDQITYPLTVALLGVPQVKTIRSVSMFGFSSIFVIFAERADYYDSRSRVLEKLSSLPGGTLPDGVAPALGPDATGLGQVFWYTLEGRDADGNPAGGWDLHELRSIQDFRVRYALQGVEGVAEVASVGGYVREYQVDVDPDAMRAFGVTLMDVYAAVRGSNLDVGAQTIEVNRVEYVVRGVGFVKGSEDLAAAVVKVVNDVPVRVRDVARVSLGPAPRRGVLDKGGTEAVGGVVVVRTGENPLEVIRRVKTRITEVSAGLPSRTLEDGRVSKVTIVPFYDRTGLIRETLGTLGSALRDETLVTILVVVVMLGHLATSAFVSFTIPLAILLAFLGMKWAGVDANIVALSGIAIAIGTIVDMGVVIGDTVLRHLEKARPDESRVEIIFRATSEVGSAILTAILTTIVGFLPVFAMEGAEGKLFKPLAWTKTLTLLASVLLALTVLPTLATFVHERRLTQGRGRRLVGAALAAAGAILAGTWSAWAGLLLLLVGAHTLVQDRLPERWRTRSGSTVKVVVVVLAGLVLSSQWLPLGPERGLLRNFVFVALVIGGWLGLFRLFQRHYTGILAYCLARKRLVAAAWLVLVLWGAVIWRGFEGVFGFVPAALDVVRAGNVVRAAPPWVWAKHEFPALGKEFMPDLDEGSYLYMPTTMPHASIGEAIDVVRKLDLAIASVPEVELAVGKIGRVESALDPAPISMVETVVNYKPEYIADERGRWKRFRWDGSRGEFVRDEAGRLIEDPDGRPFRQWREGIRSPDDIWDEIVTAAKIPGTTSAPRLQPIAARIVMLQSGVRAPMAVKIKGPDLPTIERVGLELEKALRDVPGVEPAAVLADRIVGKPYLEIVIDRETIARYGLNVRDVQDVIEVAVGGMPVTTTVEGRERYPVRVRYLRELRDSPEALGEIVVPTMHGAQIPLAQLADIRYVRGPEMIRSEDGFLTGYVVFDKQAGHAEVDVVEAARDHLDALVREGRLEAPPGVSWSFTGSWENQVRAEAKLRVILPIALGLIFLLLYLQFHHVPTTAVIFSGILVAWAGGFQMIWLYAQPWFLDLSLFGVDMRQLFQVHPINLSVAVWVGFLALFGIASDDGVIMTTFLTQEFDRRKPATREEIRAATIDAALRRIRPCLQTVGTTILALIPVLTSVGRGSDVMVPMAIPTFGGMTVVLLTLLVVPTYWCWMQERRLK